MADEGLGPEIEAMAAVGHFHSAGEFTLDPSRALEKMREFQLAEPRQWVLGLMAAAVSGRALQVKVKIDGSGLSFTAYGDALCAEEMTSLFQAPFQPDFSPSSRELAIALNAASGLPYVSLVLESGCHTLTIENGQVSMAQKGSGLDRGWRVTARSGGSFFGSLFKSGEKFEEAQILAQRCALAPLSEFTVNGDNCRYGMELPACLAYSVVRSRAGLDPGAVRADGAVCWTKTNEDDFALVMVLGVGGEEPPLTVVRLGVSFQEEVEWSLPMSAYVWVGDQLRLDASQSAVVRDEAWSELLQRMESEADLLAEYWLEQGAGYADGLGETAKFVGRKLKDRAPRDRREPAKAALKDLLGEVERPCGCCGHSDFEEVPMLVDGKPLEYLRAGRKTAVVGLLCLGCGSLTMRAANP